LEVQKTVISQGNTEQKVQCKRYQDTTSSYCTEP
jgi:hypothetical protein